MIFNSGWSKGDIWSLTYKELFEYIKLYYENEQTKLFELFKCFCVYNAESTGIAFSGDKKSIQDYHKTVSNRTLNAVEEKQEENNLEEQFRDFGNGE